jgi:hypothetical protein
MTHPKFPASVCFEPAQATATTPAQELELAGADWIFWYIAKSSHIAPSLI